MTVGNVPSRYYRLAVRRLAVAGLVVALAPAAGFAVEGESEIGMGLGVSDNVFRSGGNPGTEASVDLRFRNDFEHMSNRSQSALRSDIEMVGYSADGADSEVVGGLDLFSSYDLAPERVSWEISNNFGQQAVDPFRASSPTNRENVNFFSTGPVINFGLGGRNGFNLEGQFSDVHYEQSPFDNERVGGQVGYSRFMNSRTTMSLMASTQDAEYDDPLLSIQDFRIDAAFLRYENDSQRARLSIEAGRTELTTAMASNTGEVVREEPLARIEFQRFGSSGSSWTVALGQEFSDGGELFRDAQDASIIISESIDVIASASPFLSQYIRLGMNMARAGSEYELAIEAGEEEYITPLAVSIPNRRRYGLEFVYEREFTPLWLGRGELQLNDRSFTELNQDDDELTVLVEARRFVTPRITVGVSYEHSRRDSSFQDATFDENRILMTVQYLFLRRGLADRERE